MSSKYKFHNPYGTYFVTFAVVRWRKNPNSKFYQFWQQNNHPIELTSNKMMDQKLDYVHNNPVEQGFINRAEDFPWSSMANYIGVKGMIDVEVIL